MFPPKDILNPVLRICEYVTLRDTAAAAAAKSLQSCPTLCDPIPGILQACDKKDLKRCD